MEVDIEAIEAFRARCREIEQSHPGFICDPEPAIADYLAAIGVMEKEA